jgi:hypothetical protein
MPTGLDECNAGSGRGFFDIGSKSCHLLFAFYAWLNNRANEGSASDKSLYSGTSSS